ncbi:hypothetical protein ACEWY4_010842 [Coilia grayii]|uniref:DUF3715 domain-containing protein n=1 Tax=Coilia grayii TaxID=363190 RepID=A0ABD1K329_9TELE
MENDIGPKEGLLEPVLPGSATFHDRILPPLHNSYLYEESKKSFIYSSAYLINNDILQKRYAAFREEKRKSGYTEEELDESFGFLLYEDESKANKLGDSGLLIGHSSSSTLGDPSNGVYVSKYSDCLDLKRWYCGKSGHIAIVRLTKGRVKEVNENYTLNFTAPTEGFDCHESDQLKAVTPTTSSFLAFERTQHYLYELLNGGVDTETCPRHVCPFAIVAFSYGKAEPAIPESSEKSEKKTVFYYQPWTGQLVIDSFTYEIGLKSSSGALLPAKLPKMLGIKNAIRVSDLRVILPKEIFETCFSGEVMVGGKCCTLFEVASTEADDKHLSLLTEELKKKDIALVFHLGDSGFFVLLHSSYFLSYEDANSEKTEALQGMFVFPETRTIHRDTKSCWKKSPLSSDILQVLPALNYAETEMEKAGLDQHEKIKMLLEKHFEHYGTLIHPGLQSSPPREASMFPDQYDVPPVFKHLFPMPKWTDDSGLQMKLYLDQPCSFEFPVKRAAELILAGREQHRDDPDDEVYYCISSPEAPSTPPSVWLEKPLDTDLHSTAEELADKSEGINSSSKELTDTSGGIDFTTEELADTLKPPESTLESRQPHHSDISNNNTEMQRKEGSPALTSLPVTSGVEPTVTAVSTEVLQPTGAVVTQKALTESAISQTSTHCDDQTQQVSSSQEVMANESTSDCATVVPEQTDDAKICETETNVALGPQIDNQALAQSKESIPHRRRRKRKRKFTKPVSKITLKQSLHSTSLSPVVATETTDGHCLGTVQDQPDTELVNQSAVETRSSEDLIKPLIELLSNKFPSETLENTSLQISENQSSEVEIPCKTTWRSYPRRGRKPDFSNRKELLEEGRETTQIHPLKRKMERESLRADLKTIITDCGRIFVPHGTEVPSEDLELVIKRQKTADCETGLKTPEVEELVSSSDTTDIVSTSEMMNDASGPKVLDGEQDLHSFTKESGASTDGSQLQGSVGPALSRQSEQKTPTEHEQHNTRNDCSSETNTTDGAQSTEAQRIKEDCSTEPQKKKKKGTEYTIISISQLRTVLRRGKKDNGSAVEKAKDTESTESETNIKDDAKSSDGQKRETVSVCQGNQDQANPAAPATDDSKSLQSSQKNQHLLGSEQKPADSKHSELDIKLGKDLNAQTLIGEFSSKKHMPLSKKARTVRNKCANTPRKWYRRKVKDILKENEHHSSDTPASRSTDSLKRALSQTASDILTGHGLEELCVASDKSCNLEVVNSSHLPADALTLLADLALSGGSGKNTKIVQNLGVDSRLSQRQGIQDSVKANSSQDTASVLHALLRRPAEALKLPAKSPMPRGLVVEGEYVVIVSKDHPYSQSPLMLGLSGSPLQALPLSRCSDSLTSTHPVGMQGRPVSRREDRIVLQVQHNPSSLSSGDKGCVNRNGWQQQSPIRKLVTSNWKERRKSRQRRRIVEKDGSIKVTRLWKEQYDFSLDSKFTNDSHDKTVTRALHGPWNVNIVDSPEELHLIFHMWIGLFYTKSTSRFFHVDPNLILQESGFTKLAEEINLRATAKLPKYDGRKVTPLINTPLGALPSQLPVRLEHLNSKDEAKNTSAPSSEALDLSVKRCRPLDLTPANTKAREPAQTLQKSHEGPNTGSSLTEVQSQLVSASKDSLSIVYHMAGSSSSMKKDMNHVSLHETQTKSSHAHENASSIKSSSSCLPECREWVDRIVKKATNEGGFVQNSSDIQRGVYSLPATKDSAQRGSSAPADSTDEISHKEVNISSESHCSSTTKPVEPGCTEDTFVVQSTLTQHESTSLVQKHDSVIKPLAEVSVNTDLSVEAAVSASSDIESVHKTPVAVSDKNYSSVEATMIVQDQNKLQTGTEAAVDEHNKSKVETILTLHVANNSKDDDIVIVQNLSDFKAETTTTVQDSQALKAGAIMDVESSVSSKAEMKPEQNDPGSVSPMAVNDLRESTSDTMVVDDPSNQKVETVMCVHEQNESKSEITMIGQNQDNHETETIEEPDSEGELVINEPNEIRAKPESVVDLLLPTDAQDQLVITEQNEQEPEPPATVMPQDDYEVQPCLAVENKNDTKAEPLATTMSPNDDEVQSSLTMQDQINTNFETVVAVTSPNDCEAQPCSTGQNQKNPETALDLPAPKDFEVQPVVSDASQKSPNKSDTKIAVQAHNDNEMMTVVNIKDQNESKPSIPVLEGEQKNTGGEKQVFQLRTETSSEENNSHSKNTAIDAQVDNNEEPMEVQLNFNLECDRSTAKNEQFAGTAMEVVREIGHQNVEHAMLLKVAEVKAQDCEGRQGGNRDLALTTENDEQVSQSSSVIPKETMEYSITDIPYDVEEQTNEEAMLPPSVIQHELEEIEKDNRCPTPTVDELPYVTAASDEMDHTMDTRIISQGSTPTQDELPPNLEFTACEESFPVVSSNTPDKAVYNTEGPDITALSHMISWFRNEQNKKHEFNSMPSQNLGQSQFRCPSSDQSDRRSHWKYANSGSQFSSNKGLQSIFSESNVQSTESYSMQYEDLTDEDFKSDDMTSYSQSRHSASEKHNALDLYASESELTVNLPYRSGSKNVAHESYHSLSEANTGKDRMEKQVQAYREREHFDTKSVSTRMRDEAYEWEDIYPSKTHSSGKRQQGGYSEYDDTYSQTWHWEKEKVRDAPNFSRNMSDKTEELDLSSDTSSSESEQESFDEPYKNYKKGEGLRVTVDFKREDFRLSGLPREPPVFTVLDDGDKQRTYENIPITKPKITMHSRTIQNTCHKGTQKYVEKFLQKWDDLHQTEDDVTQSSMDFEYLVFSEKMTDLLKSSRSKEQQTLNTACKPPMTIQFSSLNEQDTSEEIGENLPVFSDCKIKVTLPGRKEEREEDSGHMPLRLQRLACKRENEEACSKISAITAECAKSYYMMMNEICTSKIAIRTTERIRKEQDSPKPRTSKTDELCGRLKEDLFERLHDNLNSVVRQACKTKYRFFILVTSEDPFFKETKDLLENEGHICVEPEEFDLESTRPPSPLLIILRNEDIAKHVCQVPHLLELKKSPSVLFAGIDQPDDFVNLTHQELFGKGGFVVIEGTGVSKLTLENMKKIVVCLEELSKKGKWKWFLHYRDSRRFKENARSHEDVHDRKHFLDCCQEAGIVEVLPYHECDVISRDQPNYLHCLIRLQVQNATARFPVFVTDTPDRSFGKNGILTMNMNTFLQILSNDSCTIS